MERLHGHSDSTQLARVRMCVPASTFSSTVMRVKRRMFWKVRVIPQRATSCGRIPTSEFGTGYAVPGTDFGFVSPKVISPASGR